MATTQPAPKAESSTAVTAARSPSEINGAAEGDPDKKQFLLHLSSQRTRRFYERAARELFASGCEELQLLALKTAVPVAVAVALSLEDKKAATISKVNTQQLSATSGSKGRKPYYSSSGVTITLHRHSEFKGTRIVPSHIFFCSPLTDSSFFAYPESTEGVSGLFASVVAGQTESLFSSQYGEALMSILKKAGQGDSEMRKNLHTYIFNEAVKMNKDVKDLKSIKFIGELSNIKAYNPNLKAAFLRMAPQKDDEMDTTGSAFIEVFEQQNCPHNSETNGAMVYLIAPRESSYKTAQEFLAAVELAAANLMAAVCDFNGYCRRGSSHAANLKRIAIVRLGLFSYEPNVTTTPKVKIAESIIKGLSSSYHFGVAPKLQFCNFEGEDALKKVWVEQTGNETVRITESNFGRRSPTEQEKS